MLNIELFKEIKEKIKAEPDRFNIHQWITDGCKTTMCIGGWAANLCGKSANDLTIDEMGELLGIEDSRCESLFLIQNWQEDYRADFCECENEKNHQEMAEVACKYIDWFIENYEDIQYHRCGVTIAQIQPIDYDY